jgi:hypothetical protein
MKLTDVLLLSLAAAFIIIGIAEMMTRGVQDGYGYLAVMLSVFFFFLYVYRKKK